MSIIVGIIGEHSFQPCVPPVEILEITVVQSPKPLNTTLVFGQGQLPMLSNLISINYLGAHHKSAY